MQLRQFGQRLSRGGRCSIQYATHLTAIRPSDGILIKAESVQTFFPLL